MTKKHFAAIAEIIRTSNIDYHSRMDMVESFIIYFLEVNPNFDSAKFKKACGVLA